MYISQTFLQVEAACQLSHNVLLFKMFIADYSCAGHGKAVSSMLPLNDITPAISSPWARGEFEEMIASEEPFLIVIAVVYNEKRRNVYLFSLSFIFSKITTAHNPTKYHRNAKRKTKNSVLCSHK